MSAVLKGYKFSKKNADILINSRSPKFISNQYMKIFRSVLVSK